MNRLIAGGNFGWNSAVADKHYNATEPAGNRLADDPWPGAPSNLVWPEFFHRDLPINTATAKGGIFYSDNDFPADMLGKILYVYESGSEGGSLHYQDAKRQHNLLHQGMTQLGVSLSGIGKLSSGPGRPSGYGLCQWQLRYTTR